MSRKPPPRWLRAARSQDRSPETRGTADWLARALARAGLFSAAEAEAAVTAGRVRVNGRLRKEPFAPVEADDEVQLDGVRVSLAAPTRAVMLHKPAGVVSAGHDPEG